MHLREFSSRKFRNLETSTIELSQELTLFFGDNAAGKSSILEAISYMVSGRSFRTSKPNVLVMHNHKEFLLNGRFSNNKNIGVSFDRIKKSKQIRFDGKRIHSLSQIASFYPTQVLSPESYHLIDSGPSERRKYLDWLLFHVEQSYQIEWSRFQKVISQRNAFLRGNNNSECNHVILDSWDSQLKEASVLINEKRLKIVRELQPFLVMTLKSLGFDCVDDLKLSYYQGYTDDFGKKLIESRERDFLSNNTLYGPHKADLRIKIDGQAAKDVLSRGQKKLLVNGLFLAQTALLKKSTDKDSLFVIDDFASELDETNQQALIEHLRQQPNVQIILSCLSVDMIKPLIKEYNSVRMFHVEHGKIKAV